MAENLEICPAHSFPNTATLSSLVSDRFKISGEYINAKKKMKYSISKINRKKPFELYTAFPAHSAIASVLHKKQNPLLHGWHRKEIWPFESEERHIFPSALTVNRSTYAMFLEIFLLSHRPTGETTYEQVRHIRFNLFMC